VEIRTLAELGRIARALASSPRGLLPLRDAIRRGEDPLGDALCRLRSASQRRPLGATYTPRAIVDAMIVHGAAAAPARVVDPGAGSGRFIVAAGRVLPDAALVAIEIDRFAALLCRAHAAAAGLAGRTRIMVGDFLGLRLPKARGTTLFVGNPPYVRHHDIDAVHKRRLSERACRLGLVASQLAGLHVHFFLAMALRAAPGDVGVLVTASEWLDVNYGSLVRGLLLGPLGGTSIHLIDAKEVPFPGAQTTAVVTCFEVGARPASIRLRRVPTLARLSPLEGGRPVPRSVLEGARRWTPVFRGGRPIPSGYVELGELCRVHRGQVTGANRIWIAGPHTPRLPDAVLFPTVTRAKELFAAAPELSDPSRLRCVVDLPRDLDLLTAGARADVEAFLSWARAHGAREGFIARHRTPWWSVGLHEPAPILATYMARRPPAFVRNAAAARHINIAHGIYPREPMQGASLDALARHLSTSTSIGDGRTYAGGLTKFEPKEMERLLVPGPGLLAAR
jgi:adenine-specific DNA-methyltransferase